MLINQITEDIRNLSWNIQKGVPAPYKEFRELEFEETLERAKLNHENIDKVLTINKTMWDVAHFLSKKVGNLIALSDRPDEATYSKDTSLLNTPMIIRGADIEKIINTTFQ